jgi:hypothetical protein
MGRPLGSKNKPKSGSDTGDTFFLPAGIGSAENVDDQDIPVSFGSTDGSEQSGKGDLGYGFHDNGKPRKRAPNGTRTETKAENKAKLYQNLAGIETMLLSIHAMMAAITHTPEIALSVEESKALSLGIANVAKHYPATVVNEKTLAWMNLGMLVMGVYGTRAVAISNNRKRKKRAAAEQAAGNVTPFQPVQFGS